MGKPKKNAKTGLSQREVKEPVGKKIMYIGFFGASESCVYCKRQFKKRMISEYNNKFFCNDDCIKAYLKING